MQSLTNYCSTRLFDVNFTSSFIGSQVNETKLWPVLKKKTNSLCLRGSRSERMAFHVVTTFVSADCVG